MGVVKRLSEEVFSKIAAGEVIERPSNALKELIENSLDAKSTIINVRIINSGLKLIEVRDNGTGIYKDDLPVVIERHTTSKISNPKDLLKIQTYGFRGEALYAISRISELQIISKTADQTEGYLLLSSEGNIIKIEPTTFPLKHGTTIKVFNLFFNNPVRKKFLSSEKNELLNIIKTFKYFAAINNDVLFTLHIEDKLKYNLIPTNLETRVKEIFNLQNAKKEETEFENYKITLVLSPEYKYTQTPVKNNFFVFVNKRIVFLNEIDKIIVNTFSEVSGERGKIEGIISIELPPDEVDSNVHPRKLEVRFLKPLLVKNLIQKSIKNFINNHLVSKPSFVFEEKNNQENKETAENLNWYKSINKIVEKLQEKIEKVENKDKVDKKNEIKTIYKDSLEIVNKRKSNFEANLQKIFEKKLFEGNLKKSSNQEILNQEIKILHYWDNCYFLVLSSEGFFIIDQHNASEKIIYSKLLSSFKDKLPLQTQRLIIPIALETEDFQISENFQEDYKEAINFLKNLGFVIETQKIENKLKISIYEYPSIFSLSSINEIINFVFSKFEENVVDQEELLKDFLASLACKSAIKKGQKLQEEELKKLFQELMSIELNPYFCPHGRNVMIKISFQEINKMFERKN